MGKISYDSENFNRHLTTIKNPLGYITTYRSAWDLEKISVSTRSPIIFILFLAATRVYGAAVEGRLELQEYINPHATYIEKNN